MTRTHRRWTEEELAILRDVYPRLGCKKTVQALHAAYWTDRTITSVYVKAHAEGLNAGKPGLQREPWRSSEPVPLREPGPESEPIVEREPECKSEPSVVREPQVESKPSAER
jgi:hypothetical protein